MVTWSQVLLKWNTQRGVVVIPRSTNEGRMRENIEGMSTWKFTNAQKVSGHITCVCVCVVCVCVWVCVMCVCVPTCARNGNAGLGASRSRRAEQQASLVSRHRRLRCKGRQF